MNIFKFGICISILCVIQGITELNEKTVRKPTKFYFIINAIIIYIHPFACYVHGITSKALVKINPFTYNEKSVEFVTILSTLDTHITNMPFQPLNHTFIRIIWRILVSINYLIQFLMLVIIFIMKVFCLVELFEMCTDRKAAPFQGDIYQEKKKICKRSISCVDGIFSIYKFVTE